MSSHAYRLKVLIFFIPFLLISTFKINRLSFFSPFYLSFLLCHFIYHSILFIPFFSPAHLALAASPNFRCSCCVHTTERYHKGQTDLRGNTRAFRKRVDRSANRRNVRIDAPGVSDPGKRSYNIIFQTTSCHCFHLPSRYAATERSHTSGLPIGDIFPTTRILLKILSAHRLPTYLRIRSHHSPSQIQIHVHVSLIFSLRYFNQKFCFVCFCEINLKFYLRR